MGSCGRSVPLFHLLPGPKQRLRNPGTAHWEGKDFVNDYEEVVDGKKMKFRDTFQEITPNSHTLVFAWLKEDGSSEPVIISKAVRHR